MAFDGVLESYIGQGLAASRPTTPNVDTVYTPIWYSTDTKVYSFYDFNAAAWVDITTIFQTAKAQVNGPQGNLTDGATINWDVSVAQVAGVTLGGNRTMAAPTNIKAGGSYALFVTQDATGSRTLTWNSVFKWPGGVAPTLSTAPGAIDIITFLSKSGTNLYGVAQLAFA